MTRVTRRRYAVAVMAREILRDAALALGALGIPVMPLKGVLFQRVLYADPAERLVSDVDVLVPERDFGRAIQTLLQAGFHPEKAGRSLIEVALRSDKGLSIDLHRRLFSPARYSLGTTSVFARAALDTELFGVPVQIADPYDTAAHLVGKFVSDHVTTLAEPRLTELLRWCELFGLEPARLATHLSECGMGRAARYALSLGVERPRSSFFEAVLSALPADPIGRGCTRLAAHLIPRLQRTRCAAVPAHLLNATLWQGAASACAVSFNRLRHARLARGGLGGGAHWKPFFSVES